MLFLFRWLFWLTTFVAVLAAIVTATGRMLVPWLDELEPQVNAVLEARGIKFVLAFGAAPVAVQLVAAITGRTGDFYWVYVTLAVFAFVAVCAALLLPRDRGIPAPQPAGAD